MKFETLEDYDNYLNGIKEDLNEIEEYLKEHPESFGTKGNYETIQYVHDIYYGNKLEFIQNLNEINIKLKGNQMSKPLSLNNVYLLGNSFNNASRSINN